MKLSLVGISSKVNPEIIDRVAQATFSYLGVSKQLGEIELAFVSRPKIQELNRIYRHIDQPTDVLSFNISEDPLVGQIFICYTYAIKSALKFGKTPESEVVLLVVHGILHILGYDHELEAEANEMENIEKAVLKEEGYSI